MTALMHYLIGTLYLLGSGGFVAVLVAEELDFFQDPRTVVVAFVTEDGKPVAHVDVINAVPGSPEIGDMWCTFESNTVRIPANWKRFKVQWLETEYDQEYKLPPFTVSGQVVTFALPTDGP